LRDFGFEGDDVFLAGHSLGGVFVQDYAYKHSEDYKGVMLMGAGI
jgi:pimeloyl-ACP methyl ester carboxylesterase